MENRITRVSNAVASVLGYLPKEVPDAHTSPNYPLYLKENTASPAVLKKQREEDQSGYPTISVIVLADGAEETDISGTVLSLTSQTYERTEMILAVGLNCASCDKFGKLENIRTIISDGSPDKLTASAEAIARGKYLMLLKAGDRLSPDAIYSMALLAERNGNDLVYADNDFHDEFGKRIDPRFKPAFSPVTELCIDYIGRPLLVSVKLHRSVHSFGGASADDYHRYVIRCCSNCKSPANIPRVLCTLKDRDEICEPSVPVPKGLFSCQGAFKSSYRFYIDGRRLSVSIIIAVYDDAKYLKRCLESMDTRASSFDHKIVLAVNKGVDGELERYLSVLKKNKAANIVYSDESSIPALLNAGAANAFSEHFIFLSQYAEVVTPDFIESLIAPLMLKGVGVCGGKLLDDEGLLMHTGTVLGLACEFGSAYVGTTDDMSDQRKCFYTSLQRNVSAVSGAMMAVSAESFLKIGLFDETFERVGWDAEFCLRAGGMGLSTVYTPFASAKMSAALPSIEDADETNKNRCTDEFREALKEGDPYLSPNYDRRYSAPQLLIRPIDKP